MDQLRHRNLYDMHSGIGIALGLFLFFISITGCFALFYHETGSWADPAKRIEAGTDWVEMQPLLNAYLDDLNPRGTVTVLRLNKPTHDKPYFEAFANIQPDEGAVEFDQRRWNPQTGDIVSVRENGGMFWLYEIHRSVMWPDSIGGRTIGRALAGLAGVIMLASIISGILIHQKLFKELFTLRFYRSVRLRWQDVHKVSGLWGLPFFSDDIADRSLFRGDHPIGARDRVFDHEW